MYFDEIQPEPQLSVILKSDNFNKLHSNIIKIFVGDDNLETGFEEIFKLCCLTPAIPAKTVN